MAYHYNYFQGLFFLEEEIPGRLIKICTVGLNQTGVQPILNCL